jgi:hypothetical protein
MQRFLYNIFCIILRKFRNNLVPLRANPGMLNAKFSVSLSGNFRILCTVSLPLTGKTAILYAEVFVI